jgi:hypothetical protein
VLLEQSEPVEHFSLFSAAGTMSGQSGQPNYNAGNTFMDAFVQYRRSLGLAALVVKIGVIEDMGYVNNKPAILDSLRATAQYLRREPDLLTSIELMLRRSSPSSSDTCRLVAPPTTGARSTHFVERVQIGISMRSTLPS